MELRIQSEFVDDPTQAVPGEDLESDVVKTGFLVRNHRGFDQLLRDPLRFNENGGTRLVLRREPDGQSQSEQNAERARHDKPPGPPAQNPARLLEVEARLAARLCRSHRSLAVASRAYLGRLSGLRMPSVHPDSGRLRRAKGPFLS